MENQNHCFYFVWPHACASILQFRANIGREKHMPERVNRNTHLTHIVISIDINLAFDQNFMICRLNSRANLKGKLMT